MRYFRARRTHETYEAAHKMVIIERFEFSEQNPRDFLGRGTFSDVFRGKDTGNGALVAIRRIPFSSAISKDLLLLSALSHKNLARIQSVQMNGMYLCLVGDYYRTDLKKFLFYRGPFKDADLSVLCKQLADGYSALYAKNIRHQNIKPQNIFLELRGDVFTAKIAEFGFRCFLEQSFNQGLFATFLYMSPELGSTVLLRRSLLLDSKTDIWSLGLVFYECSMGSLPFGEETALRLFLAAADQELYRSVMLLTKPF